MSFYFVQTNPKYKRSAISRVIKKCTVTKRLIIHSTYNSINGFRCTTVVFDDPNESTTNSALQLHKYDTQEMTKDFYDKYRNALDIISNT